MHADVVYEWHRADAHGHGIQVTTAVRTGTLQCTHAASCKKEARMGTNAHRLGTIPGEWPQHVATYATPHQVADNRVSEYQWRAAVSNVG